MGENSPKYVVKNVDMSDEMQQDAFAISNTALQEFNIEKDIAAYIKKEVSYRFICFRKLRFRFSGYSSIRNMVPLGTALSAGTTVVTWLTKRNTLSTSMLVNWPYYCFVLDRCVACGSVTVIWLIIWSICFGSIVFFCVCSYPRNRMYICCGNRSSVFEHLRVLINRRLWITSVLVNFLLSAFLKQDHLISSRVCLRSIELYWLILRKL